jgi:hypothetical protein
VLDLYGVYYGFYLFCWDKYMTYIFVWPYMYTRLSVDIAAVVSLSPTVFFSSGCDNYIVQPLFELIELYFRKYMYVLYNLLLNSISFNSCQWLIAKHAYTINDYCRSSRQTSNLQSPSREKRKKEKKYMTDHVNCN